MLTEQCRSQLGCDGIAAEPIRQRRDGLCDKAYPKGKMLTISASFHHRDLNRLIMDYLVIEGYKDAAERFSNETGLSPLVDLESIENRMNIRSAIQRGDVDDAIGRVNELDPEVSRRLSGAVERKNRGRNRATLRCYYDDTFTCTTPRLFMSSVPIMFTPKERYT